MNPKAYKNNSVNPCRFKNPKIFLLGIIKDISMVYTGSLAEQVVKGVTKIVINRSFQLAMVLVDMTAGMAQAVPEINGIILFPFIPNRRIILSIKNTTLLIYPVSSNMAINKKSMAICGIKMSIPPTPGIMPLVIKSFKTPFASFVFTSSLKSAKKPSI